MVKYQFHLQMPHKLMLTHTTHLLPMEVARLSHIIIHQPLWDKFLKEATTQSKIKEQLYINNLLAHYQIILNIKFDKYQYQTRIRRQPPHILTLNLLEMFHKEDKMSFILMEHSIQHKMCNILELYLLQVLAMLIQLQLIDRNLTLSWHCKKLISNFKWAVKCFLHDFISFYIINNILYTIIDLIEINSLKFNDKT